MTLSKAKLAERRRSETLADRQARVGIVANPNRVPLQAPVPRDVWTRWPDLRSAHRRKNRPQSMGVHLSDPDPLADFVRSVRGHNAPLSGVPDGAGFAAIPISRRLLIVMLGALTFGAAVYLFAMVARNL